MSVNTLKIHGWTVMWVTLDIHRSDIVFWVRFRSWNFGVKHVFLDIFEDVPKKHPKLPQKKFFFLKSSVFRRACRPKRLRRPFRMCAGALLANMGKIGIQPPFRDCSNFPQELKRNWNDPRFNSPFKMAGARFNSWNPPFFHFSNFDAPPFARFKRHSHQTRTSPSKFIRLYETAGAAPLASLPAPLEPTTSRSSEKKTDKLVT